MYDILELSKKLLPELREIGKELDIKRVESFKKQDLIYKILDKQAITTSESKKPEKKILPRIKTQEQSDPQEENITVRSSEENTVVPAEKIDPPASEPIPERQPLIKPFPKRMENPGSDNIDTRERRPRVLKTESALVASSSKVAEEESRKKESETEVAISTEETKPENLEKPETQSIEKPEKSSRTERPERPEKSETETVTHTSAFSKTHCHPSNRSQSAKTNYPTTEIQGD